MRNRINSSTSPSGNHLTWLCRIMCTNHILDPSPRPVKGSEPLAGVNPSFDRSMVLFHNIMSKAAQYYKVLAELEPGDAASHINLGQAHLGIFEFNRAGRDGRGKPVAPRYAVRTQCGGNSLCGGPHSGSNGARNPCAE